MGLVDGWMSGLGEEEFIVILPMLRRAFSSIDRAERRRLLDTLRRPMTTARAGSDGPPASMAAHSAGFEAALPLLLEHPGHRPGEASAMTDGTVDGDERLRRWRLALGSDNEDLSERDQRLAQALAQLYDSEDEHKSRHNVGRGASAPRVARWLGDIREFFPSACGPGHSKGRLRAAGPQADAPRCLNFLLPSRPTST